LNDHRRLHGLDRAAVGGRPGTDLTKTLWKVGLVLSLYLEALVPIRQFEVVLPVFLDDLADFASSKTLDSTAHQG
jgi:hypothetical protein